MARTDHEPRIRATHAYFLEAATIALLVLGPALVIALAFDMDSGSVADWVAAVATVAAVVAAIFAARYTKDARDIERVRDRERDMAQQRHQAEQVAVWAATQIVWESPYDTAAFRSGRLRKTQLGVWEPISAPVTIRNRSGLPISDFSVEIYIGDVLAATVRYPAPVVGTRKGVEVITSDVRLDLVAEIAKLPVDPLRAPRLQFGWSFADLVGRKWRWIPDQGLKALPVID